MLLCKRARWHIDHIQRFCYEIVPLLYDLSICDIHSFKMAKIKALSYFMFNTTCKHAPIAAT
jgi:hypothetical protein